MRQPPERSKTIAKEAADWLVAMDDDLEQFDHRAFLTWLKSSPEHVREFLLVSTTSQQVKEKLKARRQRQKE